MATINYVSKEAAAELVTKIGETFVKQEEGKGLSSTDYTQAEKDKLGTLENYELPHASEEVLGGIKVGEGLSIDGDGVLSVVGGGGGASGTDISTAVVTLDHDSFPYDGESHEPKIVSVMLGDVTLQQEVDYYTISEPKTDAGSYGIIIVGVFKYGGSVSKPWSIEKIDDTLTLSAESVTVKGVMGTTNSTISVTHSSTGALSAAVVEGTGNVMAEMEGNKVKLTSVKAGECTVTITSAADTNYNETSKELAVTVERANGSISISPSTVALGGEAGNTAKVTLTVQGTGAITVTGGESYFTYQVDSTRKTLTLTTVKASESPLSCKVNVAADDDYAEASTTMTVNMETGKVFGVTWDGTESTKWTRTDDAKDFVDPVPYNSGTNKSNYSSPFDAYDPWKTMGGNTVEDTYIGTAVKIPKFWYELKPSGSTGLSLRIADHAESGFKVAPAFMQWSNSLPERSAVLVGRYHCGSDFKSKTGISPVVNVTRDAVRQGVTKLDSSGGTTHQLTYAVWFSIQMMYLVEFADWDSQGKIGFGNCGSLKASGSTDSMPYHTGTMQSDTSKSGGGVQYRHIEDPWDNVYDWMDGCYYNSSGLNAQLDPSKFKDCDSQSGGTLTAPITTNGYPSKFGVSSTGPFTVFYPSESNGSSSTLSCDYWNYNGSGPCLRVGGDYGSGANYGLFCVSCGGASGSFGYLGGRPTRLIK